jgi:hypothetical protein
MNTSKTITKTTTLAILAIAAVGIIVSSTAIANPALAKVTTTQFPNQTYVM